MHIRVFPVFHFHFFRCHLRSPAFPLKQQFDPQSFRSSRNLTACFPSLRLLLQLDFQHECFHICKVFDIFSYAMRFSFGTFRSNSHTRTHLDVQVRSAACDGRLGSFFSTELSSVLQNAIRIAFHAGIVHLRCHNAMSLFFIIIVFIRTCHVFKSFFNFHVFRVI